jgi:GT2 family glycosyltransferase
MTILAPALSRTTKTQEIDIVVPTHGRAHLLRRLLTALTPQLRLAPECGLVVVNDGTHDAEYAEVVSRFDGVLKYIPLERGYGPARCRNVGAQASQAEFLIFTDDDCFPPPHWLDWAMSRLKSLPGIDVVGGTTIPPKINFSPTNIECFNRALHLYPRPLFWKGEMYCLPTANVAVRRSVFIQAGGFDESFRFAAGEDTEFFYRLRMKGARFFIDMQWQTEHPIADGLRSFIRRWYRYGYGNAQHRMRTGDPFENGVPPDLTLSKILRGLLKYVEERRDYVTQHLEYNGGNEGKRKWKLVFTPLAAAQRFAYQFGGYRAYRSERYNALPKLRRHSDTACKRFER